MGQENQNRNLIFGVEVPISYFSQIQIECKSQNFGFGVPISRFPETHFFKNRNFKFWQSNSAFSSNFDSNFQFFRVYIQNFPSHLAKYPNILFTKFFSTIITPIRSSSALAIWRLRKYFQPKLKFQIVLIKESEIIENFKLSQKAKRTRFFRREN